MSGINIFCNIGNTEKMYEKEMYLQKLRKVKLETRVVGHPIKGLIVPVMLLNSVNRVVRDEILFDFILFAIYCACEEY